MLLPTPISFSPHGADFADTPAPPHFDAIPSTPGVYRIVPASGEAHISWSSNLQRRAKRLRAILKQGVLRLDCWPAASKLDSSLLLYELTRLEFPADYIRRLRFRPPWFLGLSDNDAYPQPTISQRISLASEIVLGPFGNRDSAQAYLEGTLGLFQVRRCPGALQPSADHPGCLYGEIGQCLRPCQLAVSVQEYASEMARLTDFLRTNGRSAITDLSVARNRASEAMDFETAAQAHKRLEKVKAAAALRDSEVGDARRFCGIALTRASQPHACQLRPMLDGFWQDAIEFSFEQNASTSRSIDVEVRERLSAVLRAPEKGSDRAEHLALFGRWARSSWCDGEWFSFQTLNDLDYRKLVRRMSRFVQAAEPVNGA